MKQKPVQQPAVPKPEVAKQSPSFDGNKAFKYLTTQTDFGPRNVNSVGHQKCLDYLTAELKKNADKVTLQSFTEKGYNETLRLTNIFASFKPLEHRRILLIAHWDTRPRAEMDADKENRSKPIPGANDGASGVAVLLELASILKDNPPPIGVDILLTDGEDYGNSEKDGSTDLYFLGARYFAKNKPASYTPQFGILLDMIGDRDLQIPLEQNSMRFAPTVMNIVWSTAEEIGVTQFVPIPGESISDDHLLLNEVGIPTIDLIDFQYPYWHTTQDTPDKCAPESLEAVGKVLSALIFTKLK
ncbi:MAG: M28 family peptidase [Bacteroidota bacterium]|nr:M28 family peptidase [Bacteroidota bacterium]